MRRQALGGLIVAICAILGMEIAVYAQQQNEPLSMTNTYNEQNEQLRESLQEAMERLQVKQQGLMEWLQEGSTRLQTDQERMDIIKQGLEQLESNRRHLAWLQQGILQLQEEQSYLDSLRERIENLQRTQKQMIQQWSETQVKPAEATEMEHTHTQTAHSDTEQKVTEETEQVKAAEAELKRLQEERSEVEKQLVAEAEQAQAAEAELKRLQVARSEAEKQLLKAAQQAEAINTQLIEAEATRKKAETKLTDEENQAAWVESELKRLEAERLEAEQGRAEASKQAEEFEKIQAEMARLDREQKEVKPWLKTDGPVASDTTLEQLENMLSDPLEACSARVQMAQQQFTDQGFSKELWLQHVFECQECCAPILTDVMDQHVTHVTEQPHTVVLFDFDQYTIKAQYAKNLNALMTTAFDASRDKVLLIGRASKIGDRGYNIALSGKRAGEIRDYLSTTFDVPDEQIRYQFFGFDPPQLTLDYAARYGISAGDLAAVDASDKRAEAKVNQSVVVIIYKGEEGSEVLNASEGANAKKMENSSKSN